MFCVFPCAEVGLKGDVSNSRKKMCHCHCGRYFIAFLCSSIFAQGYVHPGINPGFVSIVVVWQENLFEFALVIEMGLKWKGKNKREGILNIRCGNILATRCRRCAAEKCAADPPLPSNLLKWSSKRSFKQDSEVRGSLRMLCPGQACTPKGRKDTRSYVCTLEGEGNVLTELQWGKAQAQFCCPAHLNCSVVVLPAINGLRGFQKNLNAGTFSCCLRRKRHFKDIQCGPHFLLL